MKRKRVTVVCVICIVMIAAIVGKMLQQMIYQNFEGKTIQAEQERTVYGKGREYHDVEKAMVSGINLTKLEKEQEAAKLAEKHREAYIADCLDKMTLEQKLAQMMILTNEKDITKQNMEIYQPGGIILFGVDFDGKTIREVKGRIDELQSYVNYPLLVGVDEEGGEVSRVAGMKEENLPKFKSVRTLYSEGGTAAIREETTVKTEFLKEMGINLNFDPVADVVSNPQAYMYERSASEDAAEVSEYVKTVVLIMQEKEMVCCLKHFPGYGNNANTHQTFALDSKELSVYCEEDFLPFQAGIMAGADMIMVSHIVMQAVDGENPASLSAEVHRLLRKDLAFSGVVIADDLNMRAVLSRMSIKEATAKAFIAGNDMIFSADFTASMQGALEAVEKEELSMQQIDDSVTRVLRMKWNRELIILE